MAIEVETKDCTALTDAEIAEMSDLCAEGPNPFEVGLLSKQAEEWVLVSTARDNGKLKGFSFCTLERIGGTPAVVIGLGSVGRNSRRGTVLRALMTDMYRRALMAFPDEDVVIGCQLDNAGAFEALKSLESIVPRPGHKASGEERAWGKRLAKRFDIAADSYDERSFTVTGDGGLPRVFDFDLADGDSVDPDVDAFFAGLDRDRGDSLIGFGWAMAEFLLKQG